MKFTVRQRWLFKYRYFVPIVLSYYGPTNYRSKSTGLSNSFGASTVAICVSYVYVIIWSNPIGLIVKWLSLIGRIVVLRQSCDLAITGIPGAICYCTMLTHTLLQRNTIALYQIYCSFCFRLLRPVSVSGNMEHALQHRDRVGVQDFVLLEDYRSEAAFIDNLKKRFSENIIYVSF